MGACAWDRAPSPWQALTLRLGAPARLQDACAYERTKALIDKYDPDARKLPPQLPPGMALGPNGALVPAGSAGEEGGLAAGGQRLGAEEW